jgi:putative transposase
MTSESVRYRYRVYPDTDQQAALSQVFGCVRVVFNDHLRLNGVGVFGRRPKYVNANASSTILITQAKRTVAREWLKDAPTTALQQAVREAHTAYRNFYDSATGKRTGRKVGIPKYRRKHQSVDSFSLMRPDFRLRQTGKREMMLRLPKTIGEVRLILSRGLPSAPSSVTIIREPDGRYYASFVVKRGTRSLPPVDRVAAVDLGLTDLATIVYSDGRREKISAPKHYRRAQAKLATAQKELARRQKGSANREKSRLTVARLHRKVRETRTDGHHKLAHRLVRDNQTVVFETLSITGLARGLHAKSVNDAAWGHLIQLTKEKAHRSGRTVVQIGRFEPTSQTCAPCGRRDGPKPLNIRDCVCVGCGARLDRDYNAAVNIMVASGTVETLNASGGNRRRQSLAGVADPNETGNDVPLPPA